MKGILGIILLLVGPLFSQDEAVMKKSGDKLHIEWDYPTHEKLLGFRLLESTDNEIFVTVKKIKEGAREVSYKLVNKTDLPVTRFYKVQAVADWDLATSDKCITVHILPKR